MSLVDLGILTKAVSKLVRLDLENTKLTSKQDEAISRTLNEGCKIDKHYIGSKDMLGIYGKHLNNTVVKFPW